MVLSLLSALFGGCDAAGAYLIFSLLLFSFLSFFFLLCLMTFLFTVPPPYILFIFFFFWGVTGLFNVED